MWHGVLCAHAYICTRAHCQCIKVLLLYQEEAWYGVHVAGGQDCVSLLCLCLYLCLCPVPVPVPLSVSVPVSVYVPVSLFVSHSVCYSPLLLSALSAVYWTVLPRAER